MVKVNQADLPHIAEQHNVLNAQADLDREKFSSALLVIFVPVTSGLLFLSINLVFNNWFEKILYLLILTSSATIVLFAVIEKFAYFISSKHMIKSFVKHFNETGTALSGTVGGNKFQTFLMAIPAYVMFWLVVLNSITVVVFVCARVVNS